VSKTVETSSKSIQDVMATEALEERLAKQTAFIKDSYAEAVSNAKELSDMMATASGDTLDIISKRATATLDEVTTIITKK
jgi:phasin family protein